MKGSDFHFFASDYTPDRVDLSSYANDLPIGDASLVSVDSFIPSSVETKLYKHSLKILIGRVMVSLSDKFSWMKMVVPNHIPHDLSKVMSEKSTPYMMPIMLKNEACYADCISIMCSYSKQVIDWYTRADRGLTGILSDH